MIFPSVEVIYVIKHDYYLSKKFYVKVVRNLENKIFYKEGGV